MLDEIVKYLQSVSEYRRELECDGMTRVVSYVLSRNKIKHEAKVGILMRDGRKIIAPHYWVELASGQILDFRARMWAGNGPEVPHGLFSPKDHPSFGYCGEKTRMTVSAFVFSILTGESKLPDEIDSAKEAAHRPL